MRNPKLLTGDVIIDTVEMIHWLLSSIQMLPNGSVRRVVMFRLKDWCLNWSKHTI